MGIGSWVGGSCRGLSTRKICTQTATILAMCSSTQADGWVRTGLSLQLMLVTGSWILVPQGSPRTWSVCP